MNETPRPQNPSPSGDGVHSGATAENGAGVCIWMTGLSGAGKTTTARAIRQVLLARGQRVIVLDGDAIRRRAGAPRGFSKADRDENVLRVATMARDAVRRGHIVVCALISPYRITRRRARDLVGQLHFIEVFIDTPLEICQRRDPKSLYAKAERGELTRVTGIDDPYELPIGPELVLTTINSSVEQNVALVCALVEARRAAINVKNAQSDPRRRV